MPTSSSRSARRLPKPERRRAIELLASCPEGCSEAIMRAHGFTTEQMVEPVRAGLATAHARRAEVRSHVGEDQEGGAAMLG
jgi:hypothetical protein